MYLPLAAVAVAVVLGALSSPEAVALSERRTGNGPRLPAWAAQATALAVLTWQRNNDYCDEVRIWQGKTSAHRPDNPRIHSDLGFALAERGLVDEAIVQYQKGPGHGDRYAEVHDFLGLALVEAASGSARPSSIFREPLRSSPTSPKPTTTSPTPWLDRGRAMQPSSSTRRPWTSIPTMPRPTTIYYIALAGARAVRRGRRPFQKALEIKGEHYVAALNNMAFLRTRIRTPSVATAPWRWRWPSGRSAAPDGQGPEMLATLAAAYAEAGRFSEAVQAAPRARDLAAHPAIHASPNSSAPRFNSPRLASLITSCRSHRLAENGKGRLLRARGPRAPHPCPVKT